MSFKKGFIIMLKKSNEEYFMLDIAEGITLYDLNYDCKIMNKNKIAHEKYTFVDLWVDINEYDEIYGIVNNSDGELIYIFIKGNKIYRTNLLKYDNRKIVIKYPYINKINEDIHILYYSNNIEYGREQNLVHYFKKNGVWTEHVIDKFKSWILTNFCVLFDNEIPTVFYFKMVKGTEEIFASTYNVDLNKWSESIQLTNSRKNKVYLSAIKDSNGKYHLTYSENNMDRYYCMYLQVDINKGSVKVKKNNIIKRTIECTFPQIFRSNWLVQVKWVSYNSLFTSYSKDHGTSWSGEERIDEAISKNFVRCNYSSNYKEDKDHNMLVTFVDENTLNRM